MTIHLLVGANVRDAEEWCRQHEMHRSEIGRTVFTTSMDRPDVFRARRRLDRVAFVHGLPDDPRPFIGRSLTHREADMIRAARDYNQHLDTNAPVMAPLHVRNRKTEGAPE